jgi:hypothetical protein
MALREDVKSALAGNASALERPKKGKSKQRSPKEVMASLSPEQRKALRARAEAVLEALDAVEGAEAEESDEEEGEIL